MQRGPPRGRDARNPANKSCRLCRNRDRFNVRAIFCGVALLQLFTKTKSCGAALGDCQYRAGNGRFVAIRDSQTSHIVKVVHSCTAQPEHRGLMSCTMRSRGNPDRRVDCCLIDFMFHERATKLPRRGFRRKADTVILMLGRESVCQLNGVHPGKTSVLVSCKAHSCVANLAAVVQVARRGGYFVDSSRGHCS